MLSICCKASCGTLVYVKFSQKCLLEKVRCFKGLESKSFPTQGGLQSLLPGGLCSRGLGGSALQGVPSAATCGVLRGPWLLLQGVPSAAACGALRGPRPLYPPRLSCSSCSPHGPSSSRCLSSSRLPRPVLEQLSARRVLSLPFPRLVTGAWLLRS